VRFTHFFKGRAGAPTQYPPIYCSASTFYADFEVMY
jgi:hypothetical protein